MMRLLSLEWSRRRWRRRVVLGAGVICLWGWGGDARTAEIDTTIACTTKNTFTEEKIIDDYKWITNFLSSAPALATISNGNYVVCLTLTAAPVLDKNITITTTEAKPLVLIGLRTTGKGLTLSGAHVTLQDAELTVDVGTGAAITLTGSHHALSNVKLKGTKQAGSYGVQASGATSVVIEKSTLENFDRGIVVGGQSQVTDTIVRWLYEEHLLPGKAATGTEALQLLGEQSVVTETTMDGYATGLSLSGAKHLLHGVQVRAYPYLPIPPTMPPENIDDYLEPTEQYPGLDGILITGQGHQLAPLVTEVDGEKIETRNTILGFATGIYLDGSATIRDNDITALHVGIQSDTVPTQASVLYPNRFYGEQVQPYAFAEDAQPKDLSALKMGKVCTIETTWKTDSVTIETGKICDEAAENNVVHGIAAPLPSSYCNATAPAPQIVLYEFLSESSGGKTSWSYEPRGWCTISPFAQPAFLVYGDSHDTIAQGTCGVHCTQADAGDALHFKMAAKIYLALLAPSGAYPLLPEQSKVASLYNLGLGPVTTVPGVGVTMTPTGGGEPGLVATGPDSGSLAAGGEITEVATATSDDEASKAGVIDGSGFSGEVLGTGLVSAGSGGGMKAGCSLVLP